jgi:hypothetical protein
MIWEPKEEKVATVTVAHNLCTYKICQITQIYLNRPEN